MNQYKVECFYNSIKKVVIFTYANNEMEAKMKACQQLKNENLLFKIEIVQPKFKILA